MRLDLNSPAALAALNYVIERHSIDKDNWKLLEHTLENEFKCKVVYEDEYGLSGYMDMADDKYTSWFLIQFGGIK